MQNIHIIENYYQLIMRRCKNQTKRISFSLTLEIFCCFCGIAAYLLFGDWDLPSCFGAYPSFIARHLEPAILDFLSE